MSQINQNEKTLVFCANQAHALLVRDLINQLKTSKDPNYCQRVTADDGALGEQHLRDFQDNEKTIPTILTTSQKLSTGVDARNVRNIVLMRPVNSMIEFKQIIGRGTRLFDGKDYFTIYDFVKAHHHFKTRNGTANQSSRNRVRNAAASLCMRSGSPASHVQFAASRRANVPKNRVRNAENSPANASVEQGEGQTRRWQGTHNPAHDGHHVLASRRHADVGATIHGNAVWQTAGLFPERS